MSDETSARLALPLLAAGQAQKELSHNEALTRLDLLVQAAVQAVGQNIPPTSPAPGDCWVIGSAPTGVWSGHGGQVAGWTSGGWRFVAARDGMTVWSIADGQTARFSAGAWAIGRIVGASVIIGGAPVVGPRGAAVAAPTGGATIDTEARAAIATILARLRSHGLISS